MSANEKFTKKELKPEPIAPVEAPTPVQAVVEQPKPAEQVMNVSQPITLVTELDSYISERIKGQPKDVPVIDISTEAELSGVHRMSLPEYFEQQSYDCTIPGVSCRNHGWYSKKESFADGKSVVRWYQAKRGRFVFRWAFKNKRAIDYATNVRNWLIVNRSYFPDAPRILFSVNGGVELGDVILTFMDAKRGLSLREAPGKRSQERVDSELNKHKNDSRFYEAKLSPETSDGADDAPEGALQYGRDFGKPI